MKIVQLTPGTGNFICGSCVRDNALVNVMRRAGHDVLMVPLYLPHVLDEPESAGATPIFFGGVNVYLQQKSALFRHTPRWLDRLFNSAGLLRWAADHSAMTKAKDLGELTVSMIEGDEGKQNKELSKLIGFLAESGRPDVVCLSNAMLVGMARRIKRELGCPVVCTLAGEDAFLDTLIEPYRGKAWELLRERAADVDAFVAVSRYYGEVMRRRMAIPAEKVHVVYNGIETEGFGPAPTATGEQNIGFLARLCHGKGLQTLVDAFVHLKKDPARKGVKLLLAGSATGADKTYIELQKKRLAQGGVLGDVEFLPNLTHEEKQNFLRRCTVFSVPATYGESFGLYLLEAWASGVPVVQPRHAAFPELLAETGGGILTEPDDAAALAASIAKLLDDPAEARRMGEAGRAAVLNRFTAGHAAEGVLRVMDLAVGLHRNSPPQSPAHRTTDHAL
jgi:glycosyltransferase involved in cell wall biosynthesis